MAVQNPKGRTTEKVRRPAGKLSAPSGASGNGKLVKQAVARAKAGKSEGLHFLYVRHAPDVLRFVDSLVHDHHEAEDITQNVFAKLMKKIDKYEEREVPFAAWILRVARNAALDHMRARRAIPTEEVRVADSGQAETRLDRSRALRSALEQLPDDQREVLVLRHIVGLSPMEIANTLDKTESSIHGLHHRGRSTLQTHLTQFGAAPIVSPPPV